MRSPESLPGPTLARLELVLEAIREMETECFIPSTIPWGRPIHSALASAEEHLGRAIRYRKRSIRDADQQARESRERREGIPPEAQAQILEELGPGPAPWQRFLKSSLLTQDQ
jgi:hypothetical protein